MAESKTLETVFSKNTNEKVKLKPCEILSEVIPNEFLIRDSFDTVSYLRNESSKIQVKLLLQEGHFVKLIHPKVLRDEKLLVVDNSTLIFQTKPFEADHMKKQIKPVKKVKKAGILNENINSAKKVVKKLENKQNLKHVKVATRKWKQNHF